MSFTRIPQLPQGGPPTRAVDVSNDLLVLEQDITRKISPLTFLTNSLPNLTSITSVLSTDKLILSQNNVANNINSIDFISKTIPQLTTTDTFSATDLLPLTHQNLTKNITIQSLINYIGNSPPISECFYVAKHGTDTISQGEEGRRGRNEEVPFLTIKKAAQAVAQDKAILGNENKPYTIFVKSGEYYEENPIYLPPGTSLIGDNLRRLSIYPNHPKNDILWLDSACYVWGFTFRGHKFPSAATAFPLSQPTKFNNLAQYNIAFNTTGYEIDELVKKPNIRVSPYVQGCTSYATSTNMSKHGADDAGGGMRIDGSLVDGFLRSMVLDSFTQVNQGGRGIHIINHGYAQLVSIFTVATKEGILCESGGSCSISTSNCTFGLSGLIARGKSNKPILEGTFTLSPTNNPNNSPYGYAVGGDLFTIENIASTSHTDYSTSPQSITIDNSINNFNIIIESQDNTPATTPTGSPFDASYANASANILAYKPQLQQQIIDYANYYFPEAMSHNPSLTAYCYRDTGYIIDAIAADIANNTNHRSIEVGNMYFKGVTKNVTVPYGDLLLPPEQVAATVATIKALNFYINGGPDISTISLDKISNSINDFNEIILDQNNTPITTPSGNPSDDSYSIAKQKILEAKSSIQQEVVDYALTNYPDAMSNNPTLTAYCYRDTGYIVDAIAADIANNANHRSIEVGNMYFKGITKNVTVPYGDLILPIEEVTPTINSISHIATYINANVLTTPDCSARQSDVTDRVADVVYPLQNDGALNAYLPAGNPSQSDIDTASIILNNRTVLQNQVSAYVAQQGYLDSLDPQLSVICNRDVGLVIDAVAYDLANGINARSIEYALAYWNGSTTRLPDSLVPDHKNKVIDTFNKLEESIFELLDPSMNLIPQYPPSFTSTGILSSVEMGSERIADVKARIANVVYPLENNGALNAYVPAGNPSQTDIDVANLLLANRTSLQDQVSNYVTEKDYLTDPALIYICRRDAGLIVDAIAHDLSSGVTARSIEYALAYWNGSTTRLPDSLVPNHKIKTIDTFNQLGIFIKDILVENSYLTSQKAQIIATYPYTGLCFTICKGDPIINSNYILQSDITIGAPNTPKLFFVEIAPVKNDYLGLKNAYDIRLNYNLPLNLKNIRGIDFTDASVQFYARSMIETGSHTFEYMGTGTRIQYAIPAFGGKVNNNNEAVFDGLFDANAPGVVFYTSSNELGDFKVGPNFKIVQSTGTIEGDVFQRSILTLVTPLNIVLE
jgi:hypothetical protein